MTIKLGVFTVSMPDYSPGEAMEKLAEIGYNGVEWRVTEDKGDTSNPSFWSGNKATLSAQELIDQADALKAKSKETGIEMPSIASYIDSSDLEDVELHFKAAQAIGVKNIRISAGGYDPVNGPYPEQVTKARVQYAKVADLAQQYSVRSVIEIHMGQLGPSMSKAMDILRDLDPAHAGIMWDPGNQVDEGYERYPMALEIAGEYLAEIHVKNRKFEAGEIENGRQTWKRVACPIRDGIADWFEIIEELKKRDYDGYLFFEDFSVDAPLDERLKDNHDWFREMIG